MSTTTVKLRSGNSNETAEDGEVAVRPVKTRAKKTTTARPSARTVNTITAESEVPPPLPANLDSVEAMLVAYHDFAVARETEDEPVPTPAEWAQEHAAEANAELVAAFIMAANGGYVPAVVVEMEDTKEHAALGDKTLVIDAKPTPPPGLRVVPAAEAAVSPETRLLVRRSIICLLAAFPLGFGVAVLANIMTWPVLGVVTAATLILGPSIVDAVSTGVFKVITRKLWINAIGYAAIIGGVWAGLFVNALLWVFAMSLGVTVLLVKHFIIDARMATATGRL